eukprot:TRINITY_DN241_c0_g1_i3.p1 TRINITY_DN241_c0_g1~~TRINITY_DN241_c0_g1_i3.p1  ORF type:complete len:559 (-),score=209.98 TRINITY_DN241_c0_g1_i3:364-2040(-)
MSIPFLPGHSSLFDQPKTNFSRPHALGFRNGVPVYNEEKPGIGGSMLATQTKLRTNTARKFPPELVAQKKALKFEAHFEEDVPQSTFEKRRVRHVLIFFHFEDGSINVLEPKVANSGMAQGSLIRRHKIPKGDASADEFYGVDDFRIGDSIQLYGKTFNITNADEDSKIILRELGYDVPSEAAGEAPSDLYTTQRQQREKSQREVKLTPKKPDALKQFLENDKRVLRFFCYWQDRGNAYGEVRKFQLHFFLSDDSLQIVEQLKPNAGFDPFPVFLRRSKPPASFGDVNQIRIGSAVEVHARTFIVYDLDEFTKDYFRKNHGVTDFTPVKLDEPQEAAPVVAPITDPALFLIPKPAKKNFQKLLDNDRKILRFAAGLVSDKPEDRDRSFVVSFYLADDTLSIYEPPQRNSGVLGGKFLERRQAQKPSAGGGNYRESDFYVGAVIEVFRHRFLLRNADDYAFNYMEANTDAFPASDIDNIQKKLRQALARTRLSPEQLSAAFGHFDADGSGTISLAEFEKVVSELGFSLSKQEMITLMRRYDLDGDGTISYEEFVTVVSQ